MTERGYYVSYHCITSSSELKEEVSQRMDKVLDEFADVFQEPRGLPTRRQQDHAITYKYPHYQKTELERLVKETLQAGIIRSNISPYNSPFILV